MNDWAIKKFLWAIIAVPLAMLGLTGLAVIGFDIPILRQIIGFIYLTFIPGIIILRILKIHRIASVETLLYSVGLSLVFNMFLGFMINLVYPHFGIAKPISVLPMVITWTVILGVLCFIAYKQDKGFSAPSQFNLKELLSPPVLFLILLPLLAALGTQLVEVYQCNTLLLILFGLIALTAVVLITLNRFIPERLYPLAVLSIGLSLLWHWSLISPYLWGWDIHIEYYYQNLVLTNSLWDYSLPSNVNAMLSITMLAPTYSLLLDMDTIWIFKIIYPVLFALVPLALFQVFRKQTSNKVAFLSVFFFMSFWTFFTDMLALCRQQVAELFLGLSLVLLVDNKMLASQKTPLLVIFGLSIVVSHYALSYIYIFYLILSLILLYFMQSRMAIRLWDRLTARFTNPRGNTALPDTTSNNNMINITYVTLFGVFCLTWYMFLSSGSAFESVVNIGNHIYQNLGLAFTTTGRDPNVLMALGQVSPKTVQGYVFLVIQYITQFFIVVGVITLILNWRRSKFAPVFIAMSLTSVVLLLMCIVLPYFASALNMTRIYHIILFWLAPFCVLGGVTTFKWLAKPVSRLFSRLKNSAIYLNLVVLLVLVPYFLFSTGFIYEVTNIPSSMALNPQNPGLSYPPFDKQEFVAGKWLSGQIDKSPVCGDGYGSRFLWENFPRNQVSTFWGESTSIPDDWFVYLRGYNVERGMVWQSWEATTPVKLQSSPFYRTVLIGRNLVYNNGGSEVWR